MTISSRGILWVLFLSALVVSSSVARANTTRTQTIALHKGWNAVQLMVTPSDMTPSAVFDGTPIAIVATYFGATSSAQFLQNPTSIEWKKEGWGVWYAPNRADAFLSTLNGVAGNRPYLVYSKQDFTWNVTGDVSFAKVRWKSDSFNLVGFSLDPNSPPTFDKFFAGSPAHKPSRIYRLVNDQWVLVSSPGSTTMNSGEAYWVYCKGGSDYQGPLSATSASGRLSLSGSPAETVLALANRGTDPVNITVQTVANGGGLPLAYCIRGVTTNNISDLIFDLPASYSVPTLEAGSTAGLYLRLKREQMTSALQSALLKISTDTGVQIWVPITGTRDDLSTTP